MATIVNFNGTNRIEPGTYTQIKSGFPLTPLTASYGNVAIIDSGVFTRDYSSSPVYFPIGSGVNGTLLSGKKAIYQFNTPSDVQRFVRGGMLYDLSKFLFSPGGGFLGISSLFLVSAKTSAPASITYTFAGSGAAVLTGVITSSTSSTVVSGVGTKFITELNVGATVRNSTGTSIGVIASIQSNTQLTLVANASLAVTSGAFQATYATAQGGGFTIQTKSEGLGANGALNVNSVLSRGFGAKLVAGTVNASKFKLVLYAGTFRGLDKDGVPYDNVYEKDATPEVLATSTEFTLLSELFNWMANDVNFQNWFVLSSTTTTSLGVVTTSDFTGNSTLSLASGGTQTYNASDFDAALAICKDLDNSFYLADRWGFHTSPEPIVHSGYDAQNVKIQASLNDPTVQYDKFMVVGGGNTAAQFDQATNSSFYLAQAYADKHVVVCHGGIYIPSQTGNGLRAVDSIYLAAIVLGRLAGLEPQVSLTYKPLPGIFGVQHELTYDQRINAIQSGVLHLKDVTNIGWCVNQAINTLQNATQLLDPNAASFEISVERIFAQINKELVLNINTKFVGSNKFTGSPADVKVFVDGYLQSRTVRANSDNLLASLPKGCTVSTDGQDNVYIDYTAVPNTPNNKFFTRGLMLPFSQTA